MKAGLGISLALAMIGQSFCALSSRKVVNPDGWDAPNPSPQRLSAVFLRLRLSQQRSDQGLTILELLIVVAIASILSAIALPSFLNLSNRAKQSEAQSHIGAANRAQQLYFFEHGEFASLNALSLGIPRQTRHYTYTSELTQSEEGAAANTLAEPIQPLRGYAGKVLVQNEYEMGATTISVLCEGNLNEVPQIVGEECPD
jgi:type IV pilus assembly protein PilA